MSKQILVPVRFINGGLCRCLGCNEVMLEDERHWHTEDELKEIIELSKRVVSDSKPYHDAIERGKELADKLGWK